MSLIKKACIFIFVLFVGALLTACGPAAAPASTESEGEHAMEDDHHSGDDHHENGDHHDSDGEGHHDDHKDEDNHSHGDHGEGHSDGHGERLPNNGAVVRIIAPEDGAEIKVGNDILVEIETENFELDEDGNHWHIFVNGESRGMIVGRDFDDVVRGLEPGDHEITAILSIGTHEELEEGDTVKITVVE